MSGTTLRDESATRTREGPRVPWGGRRHSCPGSGHGSDHWTGGRTRSASCGDVCSGGSPHADHTSAAVGVRVRTFRSGPVMACRSGGGMSIILLMSSMLPLADVRERLSPIVSSVEKTHERVVITKNGRPAAVLISYDDLESLEETLEILADPEAVRAIRESLASTERFSIDDIRRDLETRRAADGKA